MPRRQGAGWLYQLRGRPRWLLKAGGRSESRGCWGQSPTTLRESEVILWQALRHCASRGILPPGRCQAGLAGGAISVPWRVLDRAERPVAVQPRADRVVEHRVKRRMVRAYPGTDGRMPSARLRMVRASVARRVDIDAADDLAGGGAEHGVGESAACGEVLCVAFEVAQVFRQAHLVRPAGPGKSRRRPDVADAGRPCGVVSGVVLGPERFQPELPGRKPVRDREVHRDEHLITHQAMLAVRPPYPPDPAPAGLLPRWPAQATAPYRQFWKTLTAPSPKWKRTSTRSSRSFAPKPLGSCAPAGPPGSSSGARASSS